MPNWCSTTVVFYGDEIKVKELEERINRAYSNHRRQMIKEKILNSPTSFSAEEWLGNIALEFGGTANGNKIVNETIVESKDGYIFCRGAVEFFDFDDEITLDIESAWSPPVELFDLIVNEIGDGLFYDFIAEEPGCELYVNTDISGEHFPSKYRILTDESHEYEDYYCDSEDALLENLLDLAPELEAHCNDELSALVDAALKKGIYVYKYNTEY